MYNKTLHMVAFVLLVVGGLNWLLVGLGTMQLADLTDTISPTLTQAVYILVGLAAVYEILVHKTVCRECGGGSAM